MVLTKETISSRKSTSWQNSTNESSGGSKLPACRGARVLLFIVLLQNKQTVAFFKMLSSELECKPLDPFRLRSVVEFCCYGCGKRMFWYQLNSVPKTTQHRGGITHHHLKMAGETWETTAFARWYLVRGRLCTCAHMNLNEQTNLQHSSNQRAM